MTTRWGGFVVGVALLASCSSQPSGSGDDGASVSTVAPSTSPAVVSAGTAAATTTTVTTSPDVTAPPSVPSTSAEGLSSSSTTTATDPEPPAPTTVRPTTTTTEPPTSTPYAVPVRDPQQAGWGPGHGGYPATDIFAACGTELGAPVNGTTLEVRTTDAWDASIDNPATRGGRSVTILGDDGVRYYLSHLDEVDSALVPGDRVLAGTRIGTIGRTGRTSACHVHFGISPPCPGPEWSVRRGAVEPAAYLDAWERGDQLSPVDEVGRWLAEHPDACATAMADPHAADS